MAAVAKVMETVFPYEKLDCNVVCVRVCACLKDVPAQESSGGVLFQHLWLARTHTHTHTHALIHRDKGLWCAS